MYLTQGLHRSLRNAPGAPATIFGDRVRTFAEQVDRVSRLAAGLRSLGVSEGARVGVLALNSDRYAELLLAVAWTDGVVVPLNTRWIAQELAYVIGDSEASVLVVDDAFASMAPVLREECRRVHHVVYAGDGPTPAGMVSSEDLIAGAQPVAGRSAGRRRGLRHLLHERYDRRAEGVVLSHENVVTAALGSQATCPIVVPGGRLLHAAPMFHIADVHAWVAQSIVGGTHVAVPRFDPAAVLAAIEEHHVTNTLLVPTMIQLLVDHPDRAAFDLSSLRIVLYGGSPMPEALLQRAMAALPHADFVQGYGMTELGEPSPTSRPRITVVAIGSGRLAAPRCTPKCGSWSTAPRLHRERSVRSQYVVQASPRATGTSLERPRRPYATDGCTPAMPATWTTRATSSSSTASRT